MSIHVDSTVGSRLIFLVIGRSMVDEDYWKNRVLVEVIEWKPNEISGWRFVNTPWKSPPVFSFLTLSSELCLHLFISFELFSNWSKSNRLYSKVFEEMMMCQPTFLEFCRAVFSLCECHVFLFDFYWEDEEEKFESQSIMLKMYMCILSTRRFLGIFRHQSMEMLLNNATNQDQDDPNRLWVDIDRGGLSLRSNTVHSILSSFRYSFERSTSTIWGYSENASPIQKRNNIEQFDLSSVDQISDSLPRRVWNWSDRSIHASFF